MPPVVIKVAQNGPYVVQGEVEIIDHEGNPVRPKGTKISLCRCGGSTTKPFCDGTHSKIGFKGAQEAAREFDAGRSSGDAAGTTGPSGQAGHP